ncbi:hypothetical protein E2K93_01250 [Thalassotalea sp. HSM 43]|uniref:hypothetical protein n=1 Tax=Thalassotalea sp. HSM 43 TaxID=2552945 RepID=UPI00108132E3|nr:hypothetical protein [Thalassotalea sp. HSM 43]QBY03075.1 hypothetical protein E2K93_01250 [Thalassotalea sp. HSM 43]
MSNHDDKFDQQLDALYQGRKQANQASGKQQQQIKDDLSARMQNSDDISRRLHHKYQNWSSFKVAGFAALMFVVAVPLFDQLKQQLDTVAVKKLDVVVLEQPATDSSQTEDADQLASLALPEFQPVNKRPMQFNAIAAIDDAAKIDAFNQQVSEYFQEQQHVFADQQQTLYANQVVTGRLIKEKDMWFIEFCDKNLQLLAFEEVEQYLLADPLLDETREGQYVDLYANGNTVLALLNNEHVHQCDEVH